MQLSPAHEHSSHLGELAQVAGAAIGLDVDGEELGGGKRLGTQIHEPMSGTPRAGRQEAAFAAALDLQPRLLEIEVAQQAVHHLI